MKCPFCQGEMKKGWITSSREISFSENKRGLLSIGNDGEDLVSFWTMLWKGTNVIAYDCTECKKIIVDYGYKPEK